MSSPQVIYACRWLIRDTFRQSLANGVFWLMLAASTVVIAFCASVSVDKIDLRKDDLAVQQASGHISLAFGAWQIPLSRNGRTEVHFLLLLLAEWVAGGGGTVLALIWTAGFLPEFLQPANATVLMSKPTPRWVLLLGKYLGVLTFAGFQVTVFILGTYLAIGLRTGFWVSEYLWGIPLLLLHFASVYSFSAFLAVWSRSTLVCVFGSVLFWFLCYGMNYGRHAVLALAADMPSLSGVLHGCADAAYWILPKPVDLGIILERALDVGDWFGTAPVLQKIQQMGAFYPDLSMWSSLAFTVGMIAVAALELDATDY